MYRENRDKVVYDNSDASLNDIIPIKDSISEYFPTGQVIWGRLRSISESGIPNSALKIFINSSKMIFI